MIRFNDLLNMTYAEKILYYEKVLAELKKYSPKNKAEKIALKWKINDAEESLANAKIGAYLESKGINE